MVPQLTAAGIFEFENLHFQLLIDESARLLYSTWLRKPTSAEYRKASGLIIRSFREKDVAYWISDSTHLEDLPLEDLKWVLKELIPAANASALQKIARITPGDNNLKAYKELTNQSNATIFANSIELEQFKTYREAVAWIVGLHW